MQVPSTLIPNCRKLPARVACLGDFSYRRIAFAAACRANKLDPNSFVDEKSECRLYIGNLDMRISEGALIKMFSPYGKIVAEDFLWHTRGRKRGEPRGFAFVQFSTKEEAELAKEKMNGKLAGGRPLVVRLASEKNLVETTETSSKPIGVAKTSSIAVSSSGQTSRSAKIAAIKNKLKAMEEENGSSKKQKQDDGTLPSVRTSN
ncbi:hypothetical protein RHGRI_008554 [Rhododendron griersonianum]|uniref:Probable RNA-binding protein 18 n=1 Tax=Rhododendron griersonianum TaxID=479676 RepID=A0AAV6L2E3_9ERIC|nr:hypothetical protein RHGRI_008554 [Rhododendron griersonianum]